MSKNEASSASSLQKLICVRTSQILNFYFEARSLVIHSFGIFELHNFRLKFFFFINCKENIHMWSTIACSYDTKYLGNIMVWNFTKYLIRITRRNVLWTSWNYAYWWSFDSHSFKSLLYSPSTIVYEEFKKKNRSQFDIASISNSWSPKSKKYGAKLEGKKILSKYKHRMHKKRSRLWKLTSPMQSMEIPCLNCLTTVHETYETMTVENVEWSVDDGSQRPRLSTHDRYEEQNWKK